MRLIDADALKEAFSKLLTEGYVATYDAVESRIALAPTIDAVSVVRCKDCRWGREACGNIECFVDSNIPTEYHGYEWFCPNGERNENGR